MVRELAEKTVTSVVPRAFGVKVLIEDDSAPSTVGKRRMISHILEANRPLPAGPETHKYVTAEPDQTSVLIEIWEQAGSVASPEIAHNAKIGEGAITRLPKLPKGSPIDVTFNTSATGVLSVEAIELRTKKRLKFDLKIKGLSGQKLEASKDTVSHYDVIERALTRQLAPRDLVVRYAITGECTVIPAAFSKRVREVKKYWRSIQQQ